MQTAKESRAIAEAHRRSTFAPLCDVFWTRIKAASARGEMSVFIPWSAAPEGTPSEVWHRAASQFKARDLGYGVRIDEFEGAHVSW